VRLSVLCSELGNRTSGQSRFALNLARGLQKVGQEVCVYCANASPEAERSLASSSITLKSLQLDTQSVSFQSKLFTPFSNVGKRVAELSIESSGADWHVVISDEAIDAVEGLKGSRSAYVTNGDLSLLFSRPMPTGFKDLGVRALSVGMSYQLRRHARLAAEYTKLFANSRFTQRFMSFLYGLPFSGVVFPPIDSEVFRPLESVSGLRYVLALARNNAEQNLAILSSLAAEVPVVVAGGADVPGCRCVGKVSDSELAKLYSGAEFLTFPAVSEFFGYAVAESLSCGTPALVFDYGGPSELISNGINGWKVSDSSQFLATALQVFRSGTPGRMRQACVESSQAFDLSIVAQGLVNQLTGK
jgi:glycosyltransferase involved in cell wall biosynthesis